jgi:HTH-type transcriptional repressor of NAD biosynthesis genes
LKNATKGRAPAKSKQERRREGNPAWVVIDQIKLICFYGPESTGKSFMAKKLAERYQTQWVPEVAREMITGNIFNREDIIAIGREQTRRVFQKAQMANKILFCDTDVITTQIYSREYLKVVPPVLYEFEKMVQYDLYFFFEPDVPWVSDGVRDLGSEADRKRMRAVFKDELDRRGITYITVSGDWEQRERIITQAVNSILKN